MSGLAVRNGVRSSLRFGGKVIHPEMHLTGDFWAAGCIKILTVSKNDPDSNSSEQKKIA